MMEASCKIGIQFSFMPMAHGIRMSFFWWSLGGFAANVPAFVIFVSMEF